MKNDSQKDVASPVARDGPDLTSEEWRAQLPEMLRGILGGGTQAKHRALSEMAGNDRLLDAVNIFLAIITGINRYARDYRARDGDEIVALVTLLRICNSMTTSIELALQGYPQQAIALQRDVFECSTLAEWFADDRSAMRRWATSDSRERMNGEFKQKTLRVKLDERAGITKGQLSDRERIYTYQSEAGAHFNAPGLNLVTKDEKFFIGPLLNIEQLTDSFEQTNAIGERLVRILPRLFPNASLEMTAWLVVQSENIKVLYDAFEAQYLTP